MNWKNKAHLLAILSRVPGGRHAYHFLQRLAGTNKLQLDRDLERAFELVDLARESGTEIEGTRILEIGTGWRPLIPIVFRLAGAQTIHTIDVNPWLTLPYALETWSALGDRIEEISARSGRPLEDVREDYARVDTNVTELSQLLIQLNIEYIYPGDARDTGLADASIDLAISSNVLEHIPLGIQTAIHKEVHRVLDQSGLSVHRFNPQDHYSTVDSSITNANFLQYSERDWNWYGGTGLAYHNRLRSRDYREMFAAAGFALDICRERVDAPSLEAIQTGTLKVSEEFASYSPEELAVDYMWVAARKLSATSNESVENSTPATSEKLAIS